MQNRCEMSFCRRKAKKHRRICSMHIARRWKENRPEAYAFNTLRCNAKRRGKEFGLTLEQFRAFCRRTGYLKHKGQEAESMSIDRIDNTRGYFIDNIRVISLSENSRKADRMMYLPHNQPDYVAASI